METPPGREITPLGGFLASLLLWLGSLALLLAVGIGALVRRSAAGPEKAPGNALTPARPRKGS